MAYSGTLVAAGQAKGVVVATGKATEIGRISGLLAEVETLTTPLVAQMAVFARWLTFLILLVAALLLAYGAIVRHYPFEELFMVVVGLSVAAIPEGLPAVLTVALAIGVQAMARRNAIVRRLPAIETLGSVSVICTDKTGTLTRNEMTVAMVATADDDFVVTGSDGTLAGEITPGRSAGRPSCASRTHPDRRGGGCSATTPALSRTARPGRWTATRWRARCSSSRGRSGSAGSMTGCGRTPSRSTPVIASWRP